MGERHISHTCEEEETERVYKENRENWKRNHISKQTQEIQKKKFSGALKRRARHLLEGEHLVVENWLK